MTERVIILTKEASMKKLLCGALCSMVVLTAAAFGQKKTTEIVLTTTNDTVSYIIGHDIARNIRQQMIDVNIDVLMASLEEGLQNKPSRLDDATVQRCMQNLSAELRAKREVQRELDKEKNSSAGVEFLKKHAKEKGVIVTKSGLQYKVLREGKGKSPSAADTVVAHYIGRLTDGKVFDNSYERGFPFETRADQVIKGWTEVLQLMKEGAKYEVVIPSELAYGERGAGDVIGPNSVLIFEIELLKVK